MAPIVIACTWCTYFFSSENSNKKNKNIHGWPKSIEQQINTCIFCIVILKDVFLIFIWMYYTRFMSRFLSMLKFWVTLKCFLRLQFFNFNLIKFLPEKFSNFPRLKSLKIAESCFTHIIKFQSWKIWGNIVKLKYLLRQTSYDCFRISK